MKKWTETKIGNGHRIIVLTDANQSLTDTKEGYNLGDLVKRCSLLSAMEAKHEGQSLRSVDRGSTTIDHILTYGVETDEIHKAGQLPFGLGFHTDHRGVFVDVDGEQLLGLRMTEPEQRESRRLSSKNNKHRQQYMEHLCKHLEAHNVFKRVGELSRASQEGTFTATQMEEYNKIDDSITDGMISAEKSLHVDESVAGPLK